MYSNIVLSRTDRIGDLILSTPAFRTIKQVFPQSNVHVIASDYAADLVDGLDCVDAVHRVDPKNLKINEARNIFKKTNCDLFISLENHPAVLFAAFLERIKVRVGPLNHWYTYLTLNKGVRQKRSQVQMHEAEYGLELLKQLGSEEINSAIADDSIQTQITLRSSDGVEKFIRSFENEKIILVHPGMGGSALNLSEQQYVEIVRALIRRTDAKIIMSFGPTEADLRARYERQIGTEASMVSFWGGSLMELAYLISKVDLVIVPSTGPLHIAVAAGRPVVTFFPPIRVQSEKRWGPFRANSENVLVFNPEKAKGATICHQTFDCIGEKCAHYRCMDSLDLNWVVGWAKQKLGLKVRAGGIRENHPTS